MRNAATTPRVQAAFKFGATFRASVVALCVLAAGGGADAQPALGSEHGVGERFDGPVLHFSPADAASGAGVHAAAWLDDRGLMFTRFGADGARVGAARGEVLDAHGRANRAKVRLRFDGRSFVVAWVLPTGAPDAGRLRVMRVSPSGVASAPLTFGASDEDDFDVDCEAASGTCALVWTDPGASPAVGGTIRLARITRDGVRLDADGVSVSERAGCRNASVAARPEGLLVAYFDNTSMTGEAWAQNFRAAALEGTSRLDVSGALRDSPMLRIGLARPEQLHPAIAYNGTHYLAIWWERRGTVGNVGGLALYGARFSLSGDALDADGFELAPAQLAGCSPLVLASSGGRFLAAWHLLGGDGASTEGVFTLALDASGHATAAPVRVLPSVSNFEPREGLELGLAGSPSGFLLAASVVASTPNATADVRALRFDAEGGVVGASIPIAVTSAGEFTPTVSFGEGRYLVGWTQKAEGRVGDASVRARFVHATRGDLEGAELRLGGPASESYPGLSAAFGHGQHALVSAGSGGPARVFRVFADGTPHGPTIALLESSGMGARVSRAHLAAMRDGWLLGTMDDLSRVAQVRGISPGLDTATFPVEVGRGGSSQTVLGYSTALASDGSGDSLAAFTLVTGNGAALALRMRIRRLSGRGTWPCGASPPAVTCCATDDGCDDRDPSTDDRCRDARCEHVMGDAGADASIDASTDAPADVTTDGDVMRPPDMGFARHEGGGCGCATSHANTPWRAVLATLLALFARSHRRRPRCVPRGDASRDAFGVCEHGRIDHR